MIGNTHNDMRETFSHHQVQWHLAWPQPPFNSKDLLVFVPLNRFIIILSITLSSRQQMTTTIGGKRQGRSSGGAKTLICIPLRNRDCISLLWAAVYCVWLSNREKKNGTEMGWAGCWAIKAALCVATCQQCWLSAPTNLVTQTHNHVFMQPQTDPSTYTSNSDKAPNQAQQGQFRHGHTNTPELIITSWDLC